MSKRVYCLYRVSTKGQVEKDDIPMQKQKCREFVKENGWIITKEFAEKGVSGYKVSAKDRDAILEIQKDAVQNKFDVLLVFMFDRIGRREDETPFVVEWFVKNGIEVWSTQEGQQKIENHVDKLMNYIRYWQASGESLKTSIRTKTRLGQIVQEGHFRGGTPSYGFQIVKKGRIGKKNKELYDIEINPAEAPAIRRMFDLADKYGFGGRRISSELKAEGIINLRTGEPFHYSTIQNALKNIMNAGVLRSGETYSDVFPELQIVPMDQFLRVKKGIEQRSRAYEKKCADKYNEMVTLVSGEEVEVNRPPRNVPRRNIGKTRLSGNIYCGHCGGRIFASTARKSHHPTAPETYERVPIYKCYNRTQHKERCDGPTSYRAQKIDDVINDVVRGIFSRLNDVEAKDLLKDETDKAIRESEKALQQARNELKQKTKELNRWSDLMLDSLDGKCAFSSEQVRERMDKVRAAIDLLNDKILELQSELDNKSVIADELAFQHKKLLSWASLYDAATGEEKKIIVSNLIKAVTVSRDYKIKIDFNISEAQYLGEMDM